MDIGVFELTPDGLKQVQEIRTEYISGIPNQPTASEIVPDRKDN